MINQERGIFKPSLKSHTLLTNPSIKRYCFVQQLDPYNNTEHYFHDSAVHEGGQYPLLAQTSSKKVNHIFDPQGNQNQIGNSGYNLRYKQISASQGATRFDPILPKYVFKGHLFDYQLPQLQNKLNTNQLIQQLSVKNINYPPQVQRLFREAEQKKTIYQRSIDRSPLIAMQQQGPVPSSQQIPNLDRQVIQHKIPKGLKKVPFLPLMGTDGQIFWSFSVDKISLWRYKALQYYNPQAFCILNFENQPAPISAVYATQIRSSIFKHERTILISIAFFNQIQFFSFDINKFEKDFIQRYDIKEKTEDHFKKYIKKIMIKVNSNFLIEKILVQNIPNHNAADKHFRPLVIFTDGGKDIEIVDLQNVFAYKSHSQYNFISMKKRKEQNKAQNQIIKLLHCRDQFNPMVHYAFVLRKQTKQQEVAPKTIMQKIRNLFAKKFQKKEEIILSIYEWNELDLKNDTLWKKLWNPARLKKINQISSKDLQTKLKQNFFQFYRLNANTEFLIADVSLIQKPCTFKLFQNQPPRGCHLKVTLINGTYLLISNFRTLTFIPKVRVNPYIEKNIPITACQYFNYRKILGKAKFLQSISQVKNKFNYFIYEPVESQKEPQYSLVDPVISQCDGLTICQGKIIYQNQMQILYSFLESSTRKRIHQIQLNPNYQKKSFIIFQKSFMTLVETPHVASSFLTIGYLVKKYPQFRQKIWNYVGSVFAQFSQPQKVNLISSLIELLMAVESSGKTKEISASKLMFDDLIKEFHAKQKINLVEETTYIEQKDLKEPLQETFAYEITLQKTAYENLFEYLLGTDTLDKEKRRLKSINSSYNGQQFKIRVTDHVYKFLLQVLAAQGMNQVSQKLVKKQINATELSSALSNCMKESESSYDDRKYLSQLFSGMLEIKQSFLTCALRKLLVGLIEPLLNIPYNQFNRIKGLSVFIIEKLEELNTFLQGLIQFCSFKNNTTKPFEETVLFCKSLNSSIPKLCLIIKLFEALSQTQFFNPILQNSLKNQSKEVTLRNILLKVGTRQLLQRITVQKLFEQNSILLDQLEQKLPQLVHISDLRFYMGWKKINSKILQVPLISQPQTKIKEGTWKLNFFDNNQTQNKDSKNRLLLESESERFEEIQARQKQQYLSIQKSLNEHSYEDFEKFFLITKKFRDFAGIILSKIYYLQINYLELKQKHGFNQDSKNDSNPQSQINGTLQNKIMDKRPNCKEQRSAQSNSMGQFLKYEQRVFSHQKYLKKYSLIRFFNAKALTFFDKAITLYKNQTQFLQKELLSGNLLRNTDWGLSKNSGKNASQISYELMIREIQSLVDLLLSQGSQLIKKEVSKKLRTDLALKQFLKKERNHPFDQNKDFSKLSQQTQKQLQLNGYLVGTIIPDSGITAKQGERKQQQIKRMYEQKINQQISSQLRNQYVAKDDSNWIKIHNTRTSSIFSNLQK